MKRIVNIFLLLAASVLPSVAQEATRLTLNQCREQALANNKKISQAKTTLEKQTYDRKSMWANFFPNFSLNAADIYSTGNLDLGTPLSSAVSSVSTQLAPTMLSALMQRGMTATQAMATLSQVNAQLTAAMPDLSVKIGNVFYGGISLTQPLFMGGKIVSGYKMTKVGERMAKTNVRLSEADVIVNTDEAYILCIKAKELNEVAKSYEGLLLELLKNVEAAYNHGMKTNNDVLKVQVKLNEVKLKILRAENASRLAQMNLAQICGMPITQKIDVTADGIYELVDESAIGSCHESLDVSSRPEYSILADKSELARLKVKVERAAWLPSLALMASGSYINGITCLDNKLMNSFTGNVGVVLKVPLWHFGEGINKIKSAKAQYKVAQLEQDELVEKMQLQLLQSANTLQESAMEVQVTTNSVDLADKNVKTSRHQYEVGTEPLSDLLEAQAMWQQASAAAVEARCQYLLNYSKYLRAAGK